MLPSATQHQWLPEGISGAIFFAKFRRCNLEGGGGGEVALFPLDYHCGLFNFAKQIFGEC